MVEKVQLLATCATGTVRHREPGYSETDSAHFDIAGLYGVLSLQDFGKSRRYSRVRDAESDHHGVRPSPMTMDIAPLLI